MIAQSPDTESWVSDAVAALAASIGAKRIAEIGVWRGLTTRRLLDVLPDAHIWGFDLEIHPDCIWAPRLTMVTGDSVKTFPETFALQRPLDFVFIDGDHEMPTVLHDFNHAWQALRFGGMLCAHDAISWPGVKLAADMVCPHNIIIPTKPWPEIGVTGLLLAVKPQEDNLRTMEHIAVMERP